jgi:hypothetical protein
MGAGFVAGITAARMKARALSLANHAAFGIGLYLAALGAPALLDAPLASAASQAELSKACHSHHIDICTVQS